MFVKQTFHHQAHVLSYDKGLVFAGSYLMCCFMLQFLYLRLSNLFANTCCWGLLFMVLKAFMQIYMVHV